MDSAKLNDWLQVIGLFGLVGSLIFVGMQLKLDREIAVAATFQDRTAAVTETVVAIAGSEEAIATNAKLYFRANPDDTVPEDWFDLDEDVEPITYSEFLTTLYFANAMWFHWDNSHFQYEEGFLPPSHWYRIRNTIKAALSGKNSMARYSYEFAPTINRESFKDEIERIFREIEAQAND